MVRPADNPFRVNAIHALPYTADDLDWDALLQRLAAMQYRGAIVGPHGSGKTTLLNELDRHMQARGLSTCRIFLNDQQQRIPPEVFAKITRENVVLLDGAEQLGAWRWRGLLYRLRKVKGLVVTTHTPRRLPTLYECKTSPALLEQLLIRLVPHASAALREQALHLFHHHRGDLRQVWFGLYDVYPELMGMSIKYI